MRVDEARISVIHDILLAKNLNFRDFYMCFKFELPSTLAGP